MVYDPDTDPRHLPDVSQRVMERTREEVEENSEKVAGLISSFEAIEGMFETVGWANLVAIVAQEADILDGHLVRDVDIYLWRYHRGQREFADFILTMPQLVNDKLSELRGTRARLSQRHQELQEEQGG